LRQPAPGYSGQRHGRYTGRIHRVDVVVRERIAGADGHARRQSGVHIRALRDRNGGR